MDTCEYGSIRDNEKNRHSYFSHFWKQMFVGSAACNIGFCLGIATGTNTVAIPQMIKEDIEVSDDIRSWLGSAFGFGSVIWLLILTPIIHIYGVKKGYLIVCAAPLIGSIVNYFATSSTQFLIGQAIQSIMQCSMTSVTILVLTEYVSPRNRSLALFLKSASIHWGIWVANATGTFFYWRYISVLVMVCSLYGLTVLFWPESPFWLARKGRMDECADSFRWARGVSEETELELKNIIEFHKTHEKVMKSVHENVREYYNWFASKEFYMPMLLILLMSFLYMGSGKSACSMYAVEILEDMTSDTKWVYSSMLILDGINVIGMYAGCYLSTKSNLRLLFFILTGIGIISLYLLSLQNFLIQYGVIGNDFRVSLALLIVYYLAISTGPMMMTPAFAGELFPVKNRLIFSILFSVFGQIIYGIFMKFAPYIFKWGLNVAFLIFASLTSLTLVILIILLPETQGKTSIEIYESFGKSKKKSDDNKDKVSPDVVESLLFER